MGKQNAEWLSKFWGKSAGSRVNSALSFPSVLLHNLFETNYESNLGPQAELNPSSLLGTCESGMALSCMSEEVQFAIQQPESAVIIHATH